MFKTILLLLFALASISATLNPTPVQQFVLLPEYSHSDAKLWRIKSDIIGLYGFSSPDQGYLKFSPESGEVKRILNETTASCQKNSFLDTSYYYSAASTLFFCCVNNNSLLTINTDSYTVQDAIPVSSSQTFQDVIIGHNEQGLLYILGLPDLRKLPATAPSELVLVNLTTKAVENHVIFNKGSDSQLFVTGYAFDSENSYVLTKGFQGGQTLISISKIELKENDYELTQIANYTSVQELIPFHNPLNIISGYFFTNSKENLLIFDKNGNLYLNQTGLNTDSRGDLKTGTLEIPATVARIGGSTFYASFTGWKVFAFSLQNGVMSSTLLDPSANFMKIALGETSEKDLLINVGIELFSVKEISTNTTLYTSLTIYRDFFSSNNYYFAKGFGVLYVFDRHKSGRLLQTLPLNYSYHDKSSSTIMNLVEEGRFCRITYIDLDTLIVSQGPLILNKDACSFGVMHMNITDRAKPFLIVAGKKYLFVSPAIFGTMETISWTYISPVWSTMTIIPEENGASFTCVYAYNNDKTKKDIQVESYKVNKLLKRYDLQDRYVMASVPMEGGNFYLISIDNNKIIMPRSDKKITILDVKLNQTVGTYDVPAFYQMDKAIGVIYDKNRTPYVTLSEIEDIGSHTTLPQLFDFTKVTPMPGTTDNLTTRAVGSWDCNYYVFDEYISIAVVRLFDTCSAAQSQKTLIEY